MNTLHARCVFGPEKEHGMSEEAPAIVGIAALAIDCTDPPGLAHWWSRVLGGTVKVHLQGYATLHTPEGRLAGSSELPAAHVKMQTVLARFRLGQEPSAS